MIHNENSRVKIPALVHLTRLGYKYIKQKDWSGAYCPKTNIFKFYKWISLSEISPQRWRKSNSGYKNQRNA